MWAKDDSNLCSLFYIPASQSKRQRLNSTQERDHTATTLFQRVIEECGFRLFPSSGERLVYTVQSVPFTKNLKLILRRTGEMEAFKAGTIHEYPLLFTFTWNNMRDYLCDCLNTQYLPRHVVPPQTFRTTLIVKSDCNKPACLSPKNFPAPVPVAVE